MKKILLIGDSIRLSYVKSVRKRMEGCPFLGNREIDGYNAAAAKLIGCFMEVWRQGIKS